MEILEKYKYMVCVECKTYNHSKYIEDAMNGFCMQQTDFPFVCVIVDDASTDGELEVIQKYLVNHFDLEDKSIVRNEETDDYVLTFARHKTNINCFFLVLSLKYNHYGKKDKKPYYSEWWNNAKYIAICEGDDYWIHPQKLQKQVDFLENNPGCSMCFHRAKILKCIDVKVGLQCDDIEDRYYSPNELLANWKVPTAAMLFRREVLEVANKGEHRILNGDISVVLNSAKNGEIKGMSEEMSVYRVQASGITYDNKYQKERLLKYPDHFKFIKDNYPFLNQGLVNSLIMSSYFNRRSVQNSSWGYLKDTLSAYYYRLLAAVYNKLINKC